MKFTCRFGQLLSLTLVLVSPLTAQKPRDLTLPLISPPTTAEPSTIEGFEGSTEQVADVFGAEAVIRDARPCRDLPDTGGSYRRGVRRIVCRTRRSRRGFS
jgi:hypothetical protein